MLLDSADAKAGALRLAAGSLAALVILCGCRSPQATKTRVREIPPVVPQAEELKPLHVAPFEVIETAGISRRLYPVTASLPLPRGAMADAGQVVVMQGAKALPTQAQILSRWPDGSTRWLLVDFQLSMQPYEQAPLTLQVGPSSPLPEAAVTVRESPSAVEVDTGELLFSVPRDTFAPLAGLSLRGGPSAGPLGLSVSLDGATYRAKPPRSVRAVATGPLRAEITIEGSFETAMDYVLRIDAYAGKPFVRLYYTFIDRHDRFYSKIEEISADLPLRAEARAFGGDGDEIIVAPIGMADRLVQESADHFEAGHFAGTRAAGWVETREERGSVLLASRFFWQEYPQSFDVSSNSVKYSMWAGLRPLLMGSGAAKTHEIALVLRPAATPLEDAARSARALLTPPVARPDPRYTGSTHAANNSLDPANPLHRRVLLAFSSAWERYLKLLDRDPWADTGTIDCSAPGPKRFGYYGMLNWGDWNFPGFMDRSEDCDGWGNLEYDLSQVLALAFLSGGSPTYRTFLDATARHYMDVDIIHHSPTRPHLVGMNHPHKALHFALDSKTTVDLGHTWNEGLISYYWLSGDRRALDAALGIADYLVWRGRNRKSGNPRQWGWPMIGLVTAYRATADPRYLDAAELYASAAMATTTPSADKIGFKMGILADGLSYVHEINADPRIFAWLRQYAEVLAAEPGRVSDIRMVPALAYVAQAEGNEELGRIAARALVAARPGGWGKSLAAVSRATFRTAALLGRLSSTSPGG